MAAQQLPALHPHPHLPHHLGYHSIAAAGMSAHNYMLQAAAAHQQAVQPQSNALAHTQHQQLANINQTGINGHPENAYSASAHGMSHHNYYFAILNLCLLRENQHFISVDSSIAHRHTHGMHALTSPLHRHPYSGTAASTMRYDGTHDAALNAAAAGYGLVGAAAAAARYQFPTSASFGDNYHHHALSAENNVSVLQLSGRYFNESEHL